MPLADKFLKFVDASPSPFHAVSASIGALEAAGYKRLSERSEWTDVKAGGRYYVTRNESALVAFALGDKWVPGNPFHIIAGHTDSPCLRVKPVSNKSAYGYQMVGVETYGGGLWHTWFDRDLSVAGRVVVEDGGAFRTVLVDVKKPICRISNLAIHLNREIYTKGFHYNKETHLAPVIATEVKAELDRPAAAGADTEGPGAAGRHHTVLLTAIADAAGVAPSQVCDFDLVLYDTQPSAIGGAKDEFIYAARLDNLMSCFLGLEAMAAVDGSLVEADAVRVLAMFDNEEVGSDSLPGAGSNFLQQILQRITGDAPEPFMVAVSKSMLVSADMAHAVHPAYAEKHEAKHRPEMHKGPVIKTNSNQRYATNAVTAFAMRQLAAKAGVPVQDFVVRQDMGCGSTIGPILATSMGMRTVDIGVPQLSMHSIREVCGVDDLDHAHGLFTAFYSHFGEVDAALATSDDA
jgi:aspartyl aminopeptidase